MNRNTNRGRRSDTGGSGFGNRGTGPNDRGFGGGGSGFSNSRSLNTSGPIMTNHFQLQQDLELELALLKRNREIIEERQRMLSGNRFGGTSDYDYDRPPQSYNQQVYNQPRSMDTSRDFGRLYNDPPASQFNRQYGSKRQADDRSWQNTPAPKRFNSSQREPSARPSASRSGQFLNPRAPTANSRRPAQAGNTFPKSKPKPLMASSWPKSNPPPKGRKDFNPTKVTKPKPAAASNKLGSYQVTQRKQLVSSASNLVKGSEDMILHADKPASRQVVGRLELALGNILKEIKELHGSNQPPLGPFALRVIKQAIRDRVRSVMIGKVVGIAPEIVQIYRTKYPKETNSEILKLGLENNSQFKRAPKLAIRLIQTDNPEKYFKENFGKLVDLKLTEMFDALHEMYKNDKDNQKSINDIINTLLAEEGQELKSALELKGDENKLLLEDESHENLDESKEETVEPQDIKGSAEDDSIDDSQTEANDKISNITQDQKDNNTDNTANVEEKSTEADKDKETSDVQKNELEESTKDEPILDLTQDDEVDENNETMDDENNETKGDENNETMDDENNETKGDENNETNNDETIEDKEKDESKKEEGKDDAKKVEGKEVTKSRKKKLYEKNLNRYMSQKEVVNFKAKFYNRLMEMWLRRRLPYILPQYKDIMMAKAFNFDAAYKETMAHLIIGTKKRIDKQAARQEKRQSQKEDEKAEESATGGQEKPAPRILPYFVKVFGRPQLPNRKLMQAFLDQFSPGTIKKHRGVNNLLFVGFNHKEDFDNILAADQTEIGNCKIEVKASEKLNPRVETQKPTNLNDGDVVVIEDKDTPIVINDEETNDVKIDSELDDQISDLLTSIRQSEEGDELAPIAEECESTEKTNDQNLENTQSNEVSQNGAEKQVNVDTESKTETAKENGEENVPVKNKDVEAVKTDAKETGTPTRSSPRLASTPSTIKTRRASKLAQN